MSSTPPPDAAPAHDATEAAPPLPNLATRVVQVFVGPAALFDRLKLRPAWLSALILLIVLAIAWQLLIPDELMRQQMMENAAGRAGDMTPEERQRMMEGMERFSGPLFVVVGTIVFTPLILAIVSGLLLLVYNVILGGEATFRQLFAATTHSDIIPTVGLFVTLPLILASGDMDTALALHLLVPGLDSEGALYGFLHGLNLFEIWWMVVLGIAVGRIYPKRSTGGAIALLLGVYVVIKAAGSVLGAVMG